MTSIRWLSIFATGLIIILATAAVHAFRLRDVPTKSLSSENLIKKVDLQSKCDSCEKSSANVAPSVQKIKIPLVQSFEEKPKTSVLNKVEVTAKKGIQQIRPGFRIKVFKKGDSDDDDDNDDDDSDNDTEEIVDSEDSEDENDSENDEKMLEDSDNDSDDDDDDEDSEDYDDDEDEDISANKKTSANDSDDEDSEAISDDDDDDEDDDSDDEDDDDNNDESEVENPDNGESDDDVTDSDTDDDTTIIIKSDLKSSIRTVKNILKETAKTSKTITKSEEKSIKSMEPPIKNEVHATDTKKEIPKAHVPSELTKKDSSKDHLNVEKKLNIPIKEHPESNVNKNDIKINSPKQETKAAVPVPEVKKQEIKSEIKKEESDNKKSETKPEVKKKEIIPEKQKTEIKIETKQEQKPELKKPVSKSEPKKESVKTDIKLEQSKPPETPKHDIKQTVQKHEDKKLSANMKPKSSKENLLEKKSNTIKNIKISRKTVEKQESHVHEALHRKNLRESDFEDFYSFLPTFAPNFSRIHNPECRRQGQILIRQLKGAKIWPLQMLDSTAKVPSGFLKGNGNQLGDYDQCITTNAKVRLNSGSIVKVIGKYCLAHVDLKPTSDEAKLPIHLAQARKFIRSVNTDPGHFIPRFTSLNWGICLPAACDAPDAEFVLRDALRHYNGTIGMRITINVDPINCYTEETTNDWSEWLDIPTIGTLTFYGLVVAITIYATVNDLMDSNKTEESKDETNEEDKETVDVEEKENNSAKNEADENSQEISPSDDSQGLFVKAFSLKRTANKLMKEASAEGDIECIHGIRALGSLALYIAHKLIPLAMTPFTNRIILTEISNSPFSVALRASLLYTDSFLLLSGVLTAYHMSQDLDKKGSIPWMKRYIARYLRLTPALFAVLLWYSWISDKIGEGPLWGTVVTQNAELCRSNMWQNLFYIQNFFPFEEMCATHTHQLALDMQLWWLAPISVWMLRSRPTWALGVLGGMHSLTIWLRYSTTQSEYLSLVIYHGISLNQLYRTANLSYSLALHRATPYLAGISLGVLLQQTTKELSLSKFLYIPGWLVCFYFGSWALYTPAHLSMRDYQYDVNEAAQYAALASVAWSLSLSWIIFACFTGNGGPLNKLLCSKPLVFLSRISYSMYLLQFLIFFYNVGSTRTSSEFSLFSALNVLELGVVIIISTIVTLLLDIPMQSAKKAIMSIDFNFGKKENDSEDNVEGEESKVEEEEVNKVETSVDVQEEQTELDESIQEEMYDYDEEQLENEHYQIEQDVIYEEEEEYDPDMQQDQYDGEEIVYEDDNLDLSAKDENQGEEDEDLQDWEWTNGELCYNPRR